MAFVLFFQYEVAKLAALLHRAADMNHPPAMKETKFLLPKPALTQREIKPAQWVQLVQSNWASVQGLHSIQAKAQLLGKCLIVAQTYQLNCLYSPLFYFIRDIQTVSSNPLLRIFKNITPIHFHCYSIFSPNTTSNIVSTILEVLVLAENQVLQLT